MPRLLTFATLLSSLALPALAAEGEAHGPNFGMLLWHVVNISVLFGVIYWFGRGPVLNFLSDRSDGIRASIEAGGERLRSAEAEMAEIRRRLDRFDEESERIIQSQVEQAQLESERAAERASQTAERIREDAQSVASQELARARQELRAEASELATELAGQLLRAELTEGDDERLVSDFIERIGERQ